MNIYRYIYF